MGNCLIRSTIWEIVCDSIGLPVNGDYGTVQEYVHHRLWHPIDQTLVGISEVGLVQILLEKGLLDDYDVDAILMEDTNTVAFARTTTDPRMNGNWPNG